MLYSQTDIVSIMGLFEYLKQFSDWRFFRIGTTAVEVSPVAITTSNQQARHINKRIRVPDLMLLTATGARQLCEDNSKVALNHESPLLIVDAVCDVDADDIYIERSAQYGARGVYEYWILDRYLESVCVLTLTDNGYRASRYRDDDWVVSEVFPEFALTARGMLPLEGCL